MLSNFFAAVGRFFATIFAKQTSVVTDPEDTSTGVKIKSYQVKLAFKSSTRPSWSRTVNLPATGKFVTESHYATTSDSYGARLFPATQQEGITAHLQRSLAYLKTLFPDATLDALYPPTQSWTRLWTPPEGGKAGQGSVGDKKPSIIEEVWQGNMMWASGAKPAPGTKFLLENLKTGKACVIQMGYETGPGSQDFLGGVTREVHWYLGSSNSSDLLLSKVTDESVPLGPVSLTNEKPDVSESIDTDPVFAKRNDANAKVEQLRITLKERGIEPGPADEPQTKYGPKIAAAVKIAKTRLGISTSDQHVTESEFDKIENLEVNEPERPSVGNPGQKLLSHPTSDKTYQHKTAGSYRKGYPEGLVVHFTAGQCSTDSDMVGTMQWGNGQGYAFWGIAPSGKLFESHKLNRWGHHAGSSKWPSLGSSLSQYLLGVEIASAGRLDSGRKSWFGKTYPESMCRTVKAAANIVAGTYVKYTADQEETLIELCLWLKRNNPEVFSFDLVLGHDAIAPGRKNDPGGALSMTMPELRELLKRRYAA